MPFVRRPWLIVFVACGGLVVLLLATWLSVNSLSDLQWLRSASAIEKSLVERFPAGTPESEIRRVLEARGAVLYSASKQAGGLLHSGEVVGSGHLRYALGGYRLVFSSVDAVALFCLDADGRLIDIEAWKYEDAP